MLEIIEKVVKTIFKYVVRVLRFTNCSSKCYGSECSCANDGGSSPSSSASSSSSSPCLSYVDIYRKLTAK